MNLVLQRTEFREDGVFGQLLNGNVQIAVTLEHSYEDGPKIPPGFYSCVRGTHQLEGGEPFETYEITEVPNHNKILLHCGNWNKDSAGCVLLGSARSNDMIVGSRAAFNKFMALQDGVQEFCLQVTNV